MAKKQKRIRTFEGLPIVDANHDVTLHIKKDDISGSRKKSPDKCAAARAGQRTFGTEVKVYLSRMYVKKDKKWVRFVTPNNAAREIISFDRGAAFLPGDYTFKAARPTQKLGVVRSTKHESTGKGTKRKAQHITGDVRVSAREVYKSK